MVELLSDGDSDAEPAARVRKAAPVTAGDLQDFKSVLSSRNSLDDTIRSLSDKEGLTDDELAHQRGMLSRDAAKLSATNKSSIEGLRSHIVSSMLDASAVEAEVDGELHHLSGSQSNWFNDGSDSGSDSMQPKMHLKPTAKREYEMAKQIRESQARQQILQHQQDMLRARGLPAEIYDQPVSAAVGIASVDVSDGQNTLDASLVNQSDGQNTLDASLVNQSESVLEEQDPSDPAEQSVLAASADSYAPITASVDSHVESDSEAPPTNLPGRLDFDVTGDSNMTVDDGLTLESNLPSVTSTGSLGVAGRSRYGDAAEDDEDEDGNKPTQSVPINSKLPTPSVDVPVSKPDIISMGPAKTNTNPNASASINTNTNPSEISSIEADSSLFMKDSLNLTASVPAPEELEVAGNEPPVASSAVGSVQGILSLDDTVDSKVSDEEDSVRHGAKDLYSVPANGRGKVPLVANSFDNSSQFDPDSTLGSAVSNAAGDASVTDSVNGMYASVDTADTADGKGQAGGGRGGDDKDDKYDPRNSWDDSSTGTASLLNTAELLKHAGVDLGRTVDSDISSLGSSVTASQKAMAADINRENIMKKANEYEAKAEKQRNHQHTDRSLDESSLESKRGDKSFGRVSSPGASSLFNDSTIHSNTYESDDNEDVAFNSDVMNFDSTMDSTLNSNVESVGDASASTASALSTGTGTGMVGALQDDNDTIEEFDGPGTTLSSGFGSRGSTVSGVAQLSGSPSDLEDFHGESKSNTSPEFTHKSATGGMTQQPRARGTTTPSRFGSSAISTPQSHGSRGNSSQLTPAGASPFDNLSRPNNLTTGSLEHSLSIDDSANFDQAAPHHLHGGDSLALSDSDNTFADVLEDSAHSTYFATPGQNSTPGGVRKFK